MKTIEQTVYTFEELNKEAQNKAISNHINFEIDVMDENSPYWYCVERMEELHTPWFIASYIYEKHKESIIETFEANDYYFYEDGSIYV